MEGISCARAAHILSEVCAVWANFGARTPLPHARLDGSRPSPPTHVVVPDDVPGPGRAAGIGLVAPLSRAAAPRACVCRIVQVFHRVLWITGTQLN